MLKAILFRDKRLTYSDQGQGPVIVLLHGYLEAKEIWDSFIDSQLEGFRVLAVDLPGHGDSGTWDKMHSMEDLAAAICTILDQERISRVLLVGHSMGGYVTMAFADLYPDRLTGYVLFHSTCFADTDEKKENRDREISLVLCGKKTQIIHVNIPKAFASDHLGSMKDQVSRAKRIAMDNSDNGIIALLNGMKNRPDRTHILERNSPPLLLIGGAKDNYIPVETFEKLVSLAPHAHVLLLRNSGHMGFIEEPEKSGESIRTMFAEIIDD